VAVRQFFQNQDDAQVAGGKVLLPRFNDADALPINEVAASAGVTKESLERVPRASEDSSNNGDMIETATLLK
jgi:hypothetical protein